MGVSCSEKLRLRQSVGWGRWRPLFGWRISRVMIRLIPFLCGSLVEIVSVIARSHLNLHFPIEKWWAIQDSNLWPTACKAAALAAAPIARWKRLANEKEAIPFVKRTPFTKNHHPYLIANDKNTGFYRKISRIIEGNHAQIVHKPRNKQPNTKIFPITPDEQVMYCPACNLLKAPNW